MKTIRKRLGKNNITVQTVQAVLSDIEAVMTALPQDGSIGYQVAFNAASNTPAALRAGAFTVSDNSEEAAPICLITINRALDQAALVAEIATLAASTVSSASS